MESKERTYKFALMIIKLIDTLPREMSCHIIARQLLRSATSIGANIVEAQASPTRKDFANYFNYSLKSANETIYWLNLLKEANKSNKEKTEILIKEVEEIANILGASLLTLRGKRSDRLKT